MGEAKAMHSTLCLEGVNRSGYAVFGTRLALSLSLSLSKL